MVEPALSQSRFGEEPQSAGLRSRTPKPTSGFSESMYGAPRHPTGPTLPPQHLEPFVP